MSGERQVVEWIDFEEGKRRIENGARDVGVDYAGGGWFGFKPCAYPPVDPNSTDPAQRFPRSQRYADEWSDLLAYLSPEHRPYAEALREAFVKKGEMMSASYHQGARDGVPVFDDGSVGLFGQRAWGDWQAAIWQSIDGTHWCYLDFYTDFDPHTKRPERLVPEDLPKRTEPVGETSGANFVRVVGALTKAKTPNI